MREKIEIARKMHQECVELARKVPDDEERALILHILEIRELELETTSKHAALVQEHGLKNDALEESVNAMVASYISFAKKIVE